MLGSEVLKKRVEEVMSDVGDSVGPMDPLSEALGIMKKQGLQEIPVIEKKKLVGFLTIRTLTQRRKVPISALVKHFMVIPPTARPSDRIPDIAEKLMARDFSSLPVTSKNELRGIISIHDIIKALSDDPALGNIPVETIMNFAPSTIKGDMGVLSCMGHFKLTGEDASAVVDDTGDYLGSVTLPDLVSIMQKPPRKLHKGHKGEKVHRDRLLSSLVTLAKTLNRGATVKDAVDLIMKQNTPVVHILEGRELVGSVSELDIMELLIRKTKEGGPLVQIAGVDEIRIMDASELHQVINRFLGKIEKRSTVTAVTVRLRHHHHQTDTDKYTVNVKLTTPHDIIVRDGYDYDLVLAMAEAFDGIEKGIRKRKDKRKR